MNAIVGMSRKAGAGALCGENEGCGSMLAFTEVLEARKRIGDLVLRTPLREAVGWFACPANAREKIKAVADYVSPYPLVHGMLDILQRPELQRLA